MRNLNELDYFSLYLGGLDGGIYVAGATATSGIERHLIEVLEDGATFSIITASDQNSDARDMVGSGAGENNLGARTYNTGDLVYAPHGGYISAYTCDKATQHYAIPTSSRVKLES